MERIWIKENGVCDEEGFSELLNNQIPESCYYVAYQTDGFLSGRSDEINDVDVSKLLEIRIFDDQMEFLARRSALKRSFVWRIADDMTLSENVKQLCNDKDNVYPTEESMYFRIGYQTLDANSDKSNEIIGEDGRIIKTAFMSTVGGQYSLPVAKSTQKIKTKTYYRYDDDGMVSADDFRICSFE